MQLADVFHSHQDHKEDTNSEGSKLKSIWGASALRVHYQLSPFWHFRPPSEKNLNKSRGQVAECLNGSMARLEEKDEPIPRNMNLGNSFLRYCRKGTLACSEDCLKDTSLHWSGNKWEMNPDKWLRFYSKILLLYSNPIIWFHRVYK